MPTNFRLGATMVSTIVVIGFVTVLILLILKPIAIGAEVSDLLKILTGTLAAKFGDVVSYHIGSSAGSKDKDAVLKDIATK